MTGFFSQNVQSFNNREKRIPIIFRSYGCLPVQSGNGSGLVSVDFYLDKKYPFVFNPKTDTMEQTLCSLTVTKLCALDNPRIEVTGVSYFYEGFANQYLSDDYPAPKLAAYVKYKTLSGNTEYFEVSDSYGESKLKSNIAFNFPKGFMWWQTAEAIYIDWYFGLPCTVILSYRGINQPFSIALTSDNYPIFSNKDATDLSEQTIKTGFYNPNVNCVSLTNENTAIELTAQINIRDEGNSGSIPLIGKITAGPNESKSMCLSYTGELLTPDKNKEVSIKLQYGS